MTVVGTDSCEVEPVQVNSVFLAIGERVNVLIKMDQTPGYTPVTPNIFPCPDSISPFILPMVL